MYAIHAGSSSFNNFISYSKPIPSQTLKKLLASMEKRLIHRKIEILWKIEKKQKDLCIN